METGARLGLIVDNTGAVRAIQVTTDQLKTLANGGKEATAVLKGLSGGMTQAGAQAEAMTRRTGTLTDSILRMKRASAERMDLGLAAQIQQLDPFQRKLTEATGAANAHKLSLGRLGQQFGNLAGSIAGTNPIVGNLLSIMGNFVAGSAFTVGILGGLALIAVAYDRITEGARKARLENESLTKALADQFAPKTGPDSETALRYAGALRQQADAMMRIKLLQGSSNDFGAAAAFRGAGLAAPTFSRDIEIERETERLRLANQAIGRARAGGAGILETVTVTDPYDKAKVENARVAKDKFQAEERGRADDLAWKQEGFKREARQLNLVPDRSTPLDQFLTPALIRAANAAKRLTDSFEDAKDRLANGKEGWKPGNIGGGIKAGIQGAAGDFLTQFSPANIAGGLVTSGLNYIVSGITDMATEFLNGGQAAKAYREEMVRQRHAYEASFASFQKNDLAAEMANITVAADQLRKSFDDVYLTVGEIIKLAGKGPAAVQEVIAQRDAIAAQEARNKALAEKQANDKASDSLEDLVVRNLRATGQGDAADRAAFEERQARESRDAYDKVWADGLETAAEALYLNTLATTQGNELLAYQNGLLSDMVRNSPSGFYGIAAYAGQYATPRDPFGTGMLPPNYPVEPPGTGAAGGSGLNPPGGSRNRPQVNVTVPVYLDGKVLTSVFVKNIDQSAAATGGAGSSRSDALNRMPV